MMLRTSLGVAVGWIGISLLVDGIPTLLLPHRLMAIGRDDAATLGLITLVGLGAAGALQPIAGRLSDRIGRAPVIAVGTVAALLGLALLAAPTSAPLGALVALGGAGVAQAGYQPLLPDRIEPAWRGRASGLKNAFDVGGAMLGFVILAALLGSGAPTAALAAAAAALVVGFAASAALLRRTPRGSARQPVVQPVGRPSGAFLAVVAARFCFLLGIYVLGRFTALYVAGSLGLGPDGAAATAGAVLAILALVTVVVSIPGGWLVDRLGRGTMLLAGGVLAAIGIALVPATGSISGLVAGGVLVALGTAAFASASWAMLADLAPRADAGWLLGVANLGTAGAAAAAGAFGILVDAAGFGPAFGVGAAFALTGGVVGWLQSPRTAPSTVPAPEVAT